MKNIKIKLTYTLFAVVFLFSGASYSQTAAPVAPPANEELSLENELNQAQTALQNTAPATAVPATEAQVPAEIAIIEAPMVPATQSEMELEEQSNIVTSDEFAMNGYSFGAVVFNHNYNVSGSVNAVNSAGTTTIDISTKSSDLQSVGVIGRYAILPIDKVGTDINMTIGTSANHNAANISSVTTIKFELNLGYTTSFSAASFYFLGGVCYEVIKGTDIEKIITSAGSGFQIGAGISLSNALKIEFLLAQTRHTLNDNYINEIKTQLLTQGFTSATTGSTSNTATSNILSSRLVYTY